MSAQSLRRDGRLLAARDALLVCAHDPCADELKVDCEKWASDNDTRIPSIVISVRDRERHDVTDARVLIDGREVPGALTGKAIDLDPGAHDIRIGSVPTAAAPTTKIQNVVLREGSKLRSVTFELGPPPRAPRPSWPAYLSGGVAVLGAAGVVGFGVEGLRQRSDLCPGGSCPNQGAFGSVNGWYVAADVSLGVTVAAASVCAILLLTRGSGGGTSAAFDVGRGWAF